MMNTGKNVGNRFSRRLVKFTTEHIFDFFFPWLVSDIAYTLLPIFVIILIQILTSGKTDFLYLSPEWSFATIVSFGAAITNIIELKFEIQHDYSHRVYSITRTIILLLIAAVVTLALVVLRDEGVSINETVVWILQLVLLSVSFFFLFVTQFVKREVNKEMHDLPSSLSRRQYFNFINSSLKQISRELTYIQYAMSREESITFKFDKCTTKETARTIEDGYRSEMELYIEKMEKQYKQVASLLQYLCQSSSRNWLKNGMNHAQAGNLFKYLG
jgi:hypothetical protein